MPLLEKYEYKPSNKWFGASAKQCQEGEESKTKIKFIMIKVSSSWIKNILTSDKVHNAFYERGYKLLFHGAKRASSVDDILRNGIMLQRGGQRRDFSNENGFYLSDDFEAAKEWALKGKESKCGVLIYLVPKNLLVFGKREGLDLSDDVDLWSSVVRYYRLNGRAERDIPMMLHLYNRSFIKGPVCKNGLCIIRGKHQVPIPLEINGEEFQQYCIRSEELAYQISPLVIGVVIYE